MPGSLQSKGDGEYPYSAPFTGLDVSVPSIVLPPSAQEAQTSPSFSIVRGSIAAPWPFATTLFGSSLGSGEYFIFATPSGYVLTNQWIYQIQGTATATTAWQLVQMVAIPTGAFPDIPSQNPVPFVEANGCLYFACNFGIYRYVKPTITQASGTFVAGTLPAAEYFVVVTSIDINGVESVASNEVSFLNLGSPADLSLTWPAVTGAVSYNVYVGLYSHAENEVFSTATNSYTVSSYTAGTANAPFNLAAWSVAFYPNYMSIFNQRLLCVGTNPLTVVTIPSGLSGTQGTGGTLADGNYYAKVTAVFPSGTESAASAETIVAVTGGSGTASIDWTWTAVTGAVSYNIYVGQAAGLENEVFNSSTNSYTQDSYAAGTTSPPTNPPWSVWTVAWSTVTTFSQTSAGSFNVNPNTTAGVVGGYDVLTNYSQGIPVGIVNLGHSAFIQMTQGIVEIDPSNSGTSAFTLYNYWQENIPVGAVQGTVAQFGPISAFVTPDNINIWVPGSQTQIGSKVMPLLRNILLNTSLQEISGAQWPSLQNPPVNSTFMVIYGELHYVLTFNIYGVSPKQASPPYPTGQSGPSWFGLILDYNFASQSWAQQVTPPLTTQVYPVAGPPLTTTTFTQIPPQSVYIVGTQASPSAAPGWLVFSPDVFNEYVWPEASFQCQGWAATPQECRVGFPQTPISAGHRPTFRRIRIEYSTDDLSSAGGSFATNITVSVQGTITQNTGSANGTALFQSTLQYLTQTIQVQPVGRSGDSSTLLQPYLTSTVYADLMISLENAQISLSWTDPSPGQRLLIHRVTAMVNDTKGVMQ